MKKLLLGSVALVALSLTGQAFAADMPTKAFKAVPIAPWSWTGFYVGAHVGGGVSIANFADPFGSPIFGDKVRSPAFFGGVQAGYNWQAPGSPWVFGVEADISGFSSDGTNTCFAVSVPAVNATCRVSPQVAGTFTGRIGYAAGASGHTLVYGKGGFGWANDNVQMALNDTGVFGSPNNSQNVTLWGWTVGAGVEQALTPAWSVKVEYDYLGLGSSNVANLGSITVNGAGGVTGVTAPGTSGLSQNIHEVKLGLNYKWGADPSAPGWNAVSPIGFPTKARPMAAANGWEIEGGGRYFASWGQYKKDIGLFTTSGLPSLTSISRLTYDGMKTNSGEFFGRVETPWNFFVKGFVGAGSTKNGQMNDEDFMIAPALPDSYSNTLASVVTGNIRYGAVDGGYDFLRAPGYKVGAFAGYFWFNQSMNAFGCTPIANINCIPAVPTSGSPSITENDKWRGLRIGLAGEAMLTDRVKISGDIAYLPWVQFSGVDQHFFGNSGVLASNNPETGKGKGVQLEATVSYYVTPQWSIGVGGRYWGMWTTDGQVVRDFSFGTIPPAPTTAPQFFKAQVEQAGVFIQTSYKFSN